MNYLGHLSLSTQCIHETVGNMVCDNRKNVEWPYAHPGVAQGFKHHQAIDRETDAHASFAALRHMLFPSYRHYAGVIVDLLIDHHLSRQWSAFHQDTLRDRINTFAKQLSDAKQDMPEDIYAFLSRMIDHGVLDSYHSEAGVRQAIQRISRRCKREITGVDPFELDAHEVEQHCLAIYAHVETESHKASVSN